MKLSKMTTECAADVLCEITPYIANITADEELLSELRNAIDPNDAATQAELIARGVEKVTKIVPILLKKRRADLFGILAALNEKTAEEIAEQNILVTSIQIRDVVKDKDLMDFFKSCVGSEGSE